MADAFNLSAYLMAFRDADGYGLPEGSRGYRSEFPCAKRITCADGFNLSVQATHSAYCTPRQNLGPWLEVEVGFPSADPELIMEYAEQPERPTETVYAYVPVNLVVELIALHGGPNAETLQNAAKATGSAS